MSEAGDDAVLTDLVEYLIITALSAQSLAMLVPALTALVESGVLRIIDGVVVLRDDGGAVAVSEIDEVECLEPLARIDGEAGRLLSADDIRSASLAVRPGTTGIVLVAEDRWMRSLAAAARNAGGQIVAGERIRAARVQEVLESAVHGVKEGS